ncbi:hypothetical protein BH09ACT12_BH09ACT12_14820 [soil metagenome]
MIRHLVARTFVEGVTPDQIAAMEERTRAFVEIPGVRAVVTGPNLGLVARSEGFEHLTIIDLDDEAAFRSFVADPRHSASAAVSGQLTARAAILDVAFDAL